MREDSHWRVLRFCIMHIQAWMLAYCFYYLYMLSLGKWYSFSNLFQGLDFIVDAGTIVADPSTVVDMTGSTPTVIRQGKVCMHIKVPLNPEYLSAMLTHHLQQFNIISDLGSIGATFYQLILSLHASVRWKILQRLPHMHKKLLRTHRQAITRTHGFTWKLEREKSRERFYCNFKELQTEINGSVISCVVGFFLI